MVDDNTLNDLLGGEDSWYEPTERKPQSMLAGGKYNAKVVGLNVKDDKEIQGQFLADIFEPEFEINGTNVKHKGLFRFKKPDPSLYPHLQADMGSNTGYYIFLDQCGLLKENKEGKIMLPSLTLDMINGMEFEVEVVVEKWTGRDGNDMSTPRVSKVLKKLSTSNPQNVENSNVPITEDELPF